MVTCTQSISISISSSNIHLLNKPYSEDTIINYVATFNNGTRRTGTLSKEDNTENVYPYENLTGSYILIEYLPSTNYINVTYKNTDGNQPSAVIDFTYDINEDTSYNNENYTNTKLNYLSSANTYTQLTPIASMNSIVYNKNNYAVIENVSYKNNSSSEVKYFKRFYPHVQLNSNNVKDTLNEINDRIAQGGRKFTELTFGNGCDVDIEDTVLGGKITLENYEVVRIIYSPILCRNYMLLRSFDYTSSIILANNAPDYNNKNTWYKVYQKAAGVGATNYYIHDMVILHDVAFYIGYSLTSNNQQKWAIAVADAYALDDLVIKYQLEGVDGNNICIECDEQSVIIISPIYSDNYFQIVLTVFFLDGERDILSLVTTQYNTINISGTNKFIRLKNIAPCQYILFNRYYYYSESGSIIPFWRGNEIINIGYDSNTSTTSQSYTWYNNEVTGNPFGDITNKPQLCFGNHPLYLGNITYKNTSNNSLYQSLIKMRCSNPLNIDRQDIYLEGQINSLHENLNYIKISPIQTFLQLKNGTVLYGYNTPYNNSANTSINTNVTSVDFPSNILQSDNIDDKTWGSMDTMYYYAANDSNKTLNKLYYSDIKI